MDRDALAQAASLVDFLHLYRTDRECGHVRELSDYVACFPGHEDLIARELGRMSSAGDGAAGASGTELSAPVDSESERLPGYRVVRELGRGGQGTVVLAEDLELRRLVALKVLRSPLGLPSASRLARLRREVAILARLDHPGICGVYRAHLDCDPPFVAMRYVQGPTLAEIVTCALDAGSKTTDSAAVGALIGRSQITCVPGGRADLERLLSLFEEIAVAVHAAHEAGVVHRDIKPPNIVVQADGRPVLLDFGLARTVDADDALVTRTGERFGTLAYMSPEQLDLGTDALDRRTDVYSLGVTIFECVTGRRPYEAPTEHRLEQAISLEPVPRASRLNRSLPVDLDVVLATAMEKDRTRRYATALDLAQDLCRVRERRPVLARPTRVLLRARRWSQRNPAIATALILLTVFAIGLTVASVQLARESARTRDALRVARSRELAATALSTLRLDPRVALDDALRSHELDPRSDSRSAIYAALAEQRIERLLDQDMFDLAALTPDRQTFAIVQRDGAVATYHLPDGEPRRVGDIAGKPTVVGVSPDGKWVAVGCNDGSVTSFSGGPQPIALHARGHDGAVHALAFSPDGTQMASGGDDGVVRLRVVGATQDLAVVPTHTGPVGGLCYSPDSQWLISWSQDGEHPSDTVCCDVHVWRTTDGASVARLSGHTNRVGNAGFSPDSSLLATGSADATVRIWKIPEGMCQRILPHPGKVHDVAFCSDGVRLATACDPGEPGISDASGASVFNVIDGSRVLDLRGHQARAVRSIDWSDDAKRLLTASYDGSARVWSAVDGHEMAKLPTQQGLLHDARFLRGGDEMIVRQQICAIIARAQDSVGPLRVIRHAGAVVHAAFSPDGSLVVTGDTAGVALVHDARTGNPRARCVDGAAALTLVTFCRRGSGVLTGASDGSCKLFDTATGRCLARFEVGPMPVSQLRILADGERFLAASGTALSLFDLSSGRRILEFRGHAADVQCLDVSPDERLLATGDGSRTVRIWGLATGAPTHVLNDWAATTTIGADDRVFSVAFNRAGNALLTGCGDNRERCYRVPSGELLWSSSPRARIGKAVWVGREGRAALMPKWTGPIFFLTEEKTQADLTAMTPQPIGRSMAMDVSPDGTRLLVASTDGRTLLWDLTDRSLWASVAGHTGAVLFAAFSPDGSCFVTASADGTARLWPMDPDAAARASRPVAIHVPAASAALVNR